MSIENSATTQENELPLKFYRRDWMERQGLTNSDLAEAFGTTVQPVSKMINKGVARQAYIDILRERFKMPVHLLPRPSREKSGPLSREERAARENEAA